VPASFKIKVSGSADLELTSSASFIEVTERLGEPASFKLRFQLDIKKGDLPLLKDARLDPGSEIQVVVSVGNESACLINGPVHAQQIRLLHGGAGSYVDVIGADASIKMDREWRTTLWDGVTDSDVISSIVGDQKYSLLPDVAATSAQHEESKHTLVQRDTDLRFVRRLARRNGMLFWVDADATGQLTAHCKRPPLDGSAGATLRINVQDPNLNTLDLSFDVERPSSSIGKQLDLADKNDLDGAVSKSPQKLLSDNGLQDITSDTRNVLVTAPVDDAGDLKARSEGALIEADFFLRARGETFAHALGQLMRAHALVDLQGVGRRHSGTWLIAQVRHAIDANAHRMEFELIRNAWGST
jgi:phage protein D